MFGEEAEPPPTPACVGILVKARAPVTLALEDLALGLPQPRLLMVLFLGV